MDQSEFTANTCSSRRQARENACERGFGFPSRWVRKWRQFCLPITEWSKAKPKLLPYYFRTQLKTALVVSKYKYTSNIRM